MKILSFWAKAHPVYSRWLIFVLCVLVNTLFFWTGMAFFALDFTLPFFFTGFVFGLLIIATAFYPMSGTYRHRKFFDGMAYMLIAFIWLGLGYKNASEADFRQESKNEIVFRLAGTHFAENPPATNLKKKWVHHIRQNLKIIKALIRNTSPAGRTILVILAIIAALGLFFLLAALSCSIACNGADALAVIVLLGGTALIVWGTVAVIKAIQRTKKKEKT